MHQVNVIFFLHETSEIHILGQKAEYERGSSGICESRGIPITLIVEPLGDPHLYYMDVGNPDHQRLGGTAG